MNSPERQNNNFENSNEKELDVLFDKISNQNLYGRLGIKTNATDDEIRKAFRTIAAPFHPDTKPDELKDKYGSIFQLYSEAKSTLMDKDDRIKYDEGLKGQVKPNKYYSKTSETSQEQRKLAVTALYNSLKTGDVRRFLAQKNTYIERGILNKEQINQLDFVIEYALISVKQSLIKGYRSFKIVKELWVNQDVLKNEEINKLPFVREFVIKKITDSLSEGARSFKLVRDIWVKEGVVTAEEINDLPFVKKVVFGAIEKSLDYGIRNYKIIVSVWTDAGAINKTEAEKFLSILKK